MPRPPRLANGLDNKKDFDVKLSNGTDPDDPANFEEDYEQMSGGDGEDAKDAPVRKGGKKIKSAKPVNERGYQGRG